MARNPRSRASKAGNRKALEMVREDMMDLPEGPEELAALPEGLRPQTKFLGTDEDGLPTVSTATPEQVSEAAATYAEKLKGKPGFEEAARVTAEGRLPGMDAPPEPAEAKAEDKLDVKPMNWTGYGGFEYSVDPARPGQIKINGKLFTDEQLRANTRKRGKEVGISDILLEKTDIENKGIKIAPKAKETATARRRRIAEQALAPSAPTPALEEFPTSDASEPEEFPTSDASAPAPEEFPQSAAPLFMEGAGAMPAVQGPSLQEAFATPPDLSQSYAGESFEERARREAALAQSDGTSFPSSPEMGPPDLRESYAGESFKEKARREKALDEYIAAARGDKQSDPEVMEARRRAVLALQPPDLSQSYPGESFRDRYSREKALDEYIAASRGDKQSDPEVMEARRRAVLALQPPDLSQSYAGESFEERARREAALAQSDGTSFPSSPRKTAQPGQPDLSPAVGRRQQRAVSEKELLDLINLFNPPDAQVD